MYKLNKIRGFVALPIIIGSAVLAIGVLGGLAYEYKNNQSVLSSIDKSSLLAQVVDNTQIICTDSDSGLNYLNIGKTCVGSDCKSDMCDGDTFNLIEYYCQSSADRGSKYYVCPNGCANGACLEALAASVTVLSPNGGENWPIGSTQTISWSSVNVPSNSYVELVMENGGYISSGLSVNDFYSWTIPNQYMIGNSGYELKPGSNYKIKASLYTGTPISPGPTGLLNITTLSSDLSDNYFTITAPTTPSICILYTPPTTGFVEDCIKAGGTMSESVIDKNGCVSPSRCVPKSCIGENVQTTDANANCCTGLILMGVITSGSCLTGMVCPTVMSFECVKLGISGCAKEGQSYSKVFTNDYPSVCCEGLTEWMSGMDTRKVVDGKCVSTGLESGWPVGICIKCGDGVCGVRESVCNCPKDCERITMTCTSFTYSNYGACQLNNSQTRNVTSSSPSGCTGGSPVTSQSCNYISSIPTPTQSAGTQTALQTAQTQLLNTLIAQLQLLLVQAQQLGVELPTGVEQFASQSTATQASSSADESISESVTEMTLSNELETFSYTWTNNLYYGMENNDDVKALQSALTKEGVYSYEITGNFFSITRQAVIDFQKKHNFTNVPGTGYVGSYTRKVLNELYSK